MIVLKLLPILFLTCFGFSATGQSRTSTDWLLIYYVPYDNNLSNLGDTIITMIKNGIRSTDVVATMQADFADNHGMKRYLITVDSVYTFAVDTERSADTKTYKEYLLWAYRTVAHKKRAVFFLNHGGPLGELGLDQSPEIKFLRIDSVRMHLANMNHETKITTDLIYFQVCNKGSIEPLYEVKDCARFTMASQGELGAPNYYYSAFLKDLSERTSHAGSELAASIAGYEQPFMYNSLTCIDNSKFEGLRKRFNAFLSVLPEGVRHDRLGLRPLNYAGDTYYDLVGFLNTLELKTEKQQKLKQGLIDFIMKDLIVFHRVEPEKKGVFDSYCGISIAYLPSSQVDQYDYLTFYKDVDVKRFWRRGSAKSKQ